MTKDLGIPAPDDPNAWRLLCSLLCEEARLIGLWESEVPPNVVRMMYVPSVRDLPGYAVMKLHDSDMPLIRMTGGEARSVVFYAEILDVSLFKRETDKPAFRHFLFFRDGTVHVREDLQRRPGDLELPDWKTGITRILETVQATLQRVQLSVETCVERVGNRVAFYTRDQAELPFRKQAP